MLEEVVTFFRGLRYIPGFKVSSQWIVTNNFIVKETGRHHLNEEIKINKASVGANQHCMSDVRTQFTSVTFLPKCLTYI